MTTMFLAFGLVMEFPIVLVRAVAGRDRDARPGWRVATVRASSASRSSPAVVTPGGDLVSPVVLGLTMYGLFEATVFVIRRTGR